eukprot:CAMPEP_0198465162 /NCGR_PEP_ID=MMETSP1456-20131121/3145_1 /TAXON_ID=1461544 ORGANISM="Unidentified sp., Strain RCC1871" /NCGR_SAMPLE_ID=MMETSP1456 /ASSEMBLY_ACC=CAM_ASM_001119 /LENGTH=55 /DNA_ID=CAMNT_0044190977 /DNA_START=6 /DNA_END=169 /DNA_ORIENTATION=-
MARDGRPQHACFHFIVILFWHDGRALGSASRPGREQGDGERQGDSPVTCAAIFTV